MASEDGALSAMTFGDMASAQINIWANRSPSRSFLTFLHKLIFLFFTTAKYFALIFSWLSDSYAINAQLDLPIFDLFHLSFLKDGNDESIHHLGDAIDHLSRWIECGDFMHTISG